MCIFRSFQVRQMLSLQKRRLERKESRKFPWRCSSRRVSFQACFNHCLRNFSLCSVIKVSLVLAVLIVSYTLKKGVLYVGCMVCSSPIWENQIILIKTVGFAFQRDYQGNRARSLQTNPVILVRNDSENEVHPCFASQKQQIKWLRDWFRGLLTVRWKSSLSQCRWTLCGRFL